MDFKIGNPLESQLFHITDGANHVYGYNTDSLTEQGLVEAYAVYADDPSNRSITIQTFFEGRVSAPSSYELNPLPVEPYWNSGWGPSSPNGFQVLDDGVYAWSYYPEGTETAQAAAEYAANSEVCANRDPHSISIRSFTPNWGYNNWESVFVTP